MKKGFTLAEVLITLAIIGVVAALTIPTVVKNYQETQFKAAYKKAYSDASRVWNLMAANSEIEVRRGRYEGGMATNDFSNFQNYFKILKNCNTQTVYECFTNSTNAEGFFAENYPSTNVSNRTFIDSQGRSWGFIGDGFTAGAFIIVDTNGNKKPNRLGIDRFPFISTATNCDWEETQSNKNGRLDECNINIMPIRLLPAPDYLIVHSYWCKTPPCYYTKWLKD